MRSEQKMVAFFVYYGFISALLIIWTSDTLSEHANDTIKNSHSKFFIARSDFRNIRRGK